MTPPPDGAAIQAAIETVIDPCSVASNVPLNVVEMGLIPEWDEDGGIVHISVIFTSPLCYQGPTIIDAIRAQVAAVEGVRGVEVRTDRSASWRPELISASGQERLEQRRRRTRELLGAPLQGGRATKSKQ